MTPTTNPFKKHYGLLSQVSQLVLEAQRVPNTSCGFYFDEMLPDGRDPSPRMETRLGVWPNVWDLSIERSFVFGKPSPGCGMVIHIGGRGSDRFLLIGWGFQVTFEAPPDPKKHLTGILKFEEKEVVDAKTGELRTLRMLNGDETRSGKCCIMPSEDPDDGGFPISVTIPARTGIAECELYALEE